MLNKCFNSLNNYLLNYLHKPNLSVILKLAGTEAVDSRAYRGATFMIYVSSHHEQTIFKLTATQLKLLHLQLNNVRRGGYTAFPKLGISIVPKKGSALFWHNLNSDGSIDSRTLHGGNNSQNNHELN